MLWIILLPVLSENREIQQILILNSHNNGNTKLQCYTELDDSEIKQYILL